MYKNLIYRIEQTVCLNLENADKADVQRSSFTAGMLRAFTEVLRGMDSKSTNIHNKGTGVL